MMDINWHRGWVLDWEKKETLINWIEHTLDRVHKCMEIPEKMYIFPVSWVISR